ncbi:hypothetical protein PSI22_07700 [Xenorhabdus sp. XENO-7]|uniref:Uncharacterized protein n=1 Tax=Xenorhabdus aichiensis TaxID=3025874 RepID=A0ABT5M377_9GAMM|nr:hypothetical protein [Xenorhabdus aichiensis]MDC9621525.1 hypothetical protein [Xenorhabdus aichiensis]
MSEHNILSAMFIQQRIQVLHLGMHHDTYPDAYLYAWESGVYPFLSDTDGSVPRKPHEPYFDFFQVSKSKGESLIKRLDDAWLAEEELTFYGLEDELKIQLGFSEWSRSDLLHLCRYFYLNKLFDAQFWKILTTNGKCPTEAHSITYPFDKAQDIYFM